MLIRGVWKLPVLIWGFPGYSGYLKNLSGNTGIGLQAVGLKCTLAAFTAGDAPG